MLVPQLGEAFAGPEFFFEARPMHLSVHRSDEECNHCAVDAVRELHHFTA